MRVLVCGGRDYADEELFEEVMENFEVTEIIQGGARGADRLAKQWAGDKRIPEREFPADWGQYGKSAGHIRNHLMLIQGQPDMVIAFPGGKGTANMIKQAKEAGVEVYEVSAS